MSTETKSANPAENEERLPNQEEIQARIDKAESILTKLRIFPPEWVSESGETKQEIEEKLEAWIERLQAMQVYADETSSPQAEPLPAAPVINDRVFNAENRQAARRAAREAEQEALQKRIDAHYYEINGVPIPVVPSVALSAATWQALPSKIMISGGQKFSEIRFVKDANGLTVRAKPCEKMNFNEKTRDKRLPYVDTILQGTAEINAYNAVYAQLEQQADILDTLTEPSRVFTAIPQELRQKLADADDLAERIAQVLKILRFLRETDSNGAEFIPPLDQTYKMTPFIRQKFAEFARLINRQLGLANSEHLEELAKAHREPDWENLEAQGMAIIVGPRGSGKNKLVEHYATISNRPLFRYVCSPDKEERDLTYDVELSDGEVVKVPTRILTAISTPNAILELDEINLLRPSVAKFFNALFDSDRSVFLSDQVIHATPGVVFVGLMNPADYNGVEDLAETIDDRSHTMSMGYPPLKEIDRSTGHEIFTHNEALILKSYLPQLEAYNDEQFIRLWNRVVNGIGAVSVSPEIANIVKDLKNIILIAHRTRQTVEACKTRSGDAQMNRDISLRGTISAVTFYAENHLWDADLALLPEWKSPWTAAQYAVAMTYLPHTETYRKGRQDKQAFEAILSEGLSL